MRVLIKLQGGLDAVSLEVDEGDTIGSLLDRCRERLPYQIPRYANARLFYPAAVLLPNEMVVRDLDLKPDSHLSLLLLKHFRPWFDVPPSMEQIRQLWEEENAKKKQPEDVGKIPRRIKAEIRRMRMLELAKGAERITVLTPREANGEEPETRVWNVQLEPGEGSVYAGTKLEIQVWFPLEYPMEAFTMRILTPIYHPLIFFPWLHAQRFTKVPGDDLLSTANDELGGVVPLVSGADSQCGGYLVPPWAIGLQPGTVGVVSADGHSYAGDQWTPAFHLRIVLESLLAMLADPWQLIIDDSLSLSPLAIAYNEWKQKKREEYLARARGVTELYHRGKWTSKWHHLCTVEFKREVFTWLLVYHRLTSTAESATEASRNCNVIQGIEKQEVEGGTSSVFAFGFPFELILEIIDRLWSMHLTSLPMQAYWKLRRG